MEEIKQLLLLGDYYQVYNYPIRKKIIRIIKNGDYDLLLQLLEKVVKSQALSEPPIDLTYVSILDEEYPKLLLDTFDPPLIMYYRGNIELLNTKTLLGVVGSRSPQDASVEATYKIIADLASQKNEREIAIVSGLAKGIDGIAHECALKYDIPTIGVLGFGFDYMYPVSNVQLRKKIETKGLIISEYPPTVGVNRWQFIARNRIISGLCQSLIVVEAKKKSGSLITAELALSENREVFIVSGNSFDQAYYGSNNLIRDGANILLDIEEVFAEYH